MVMEQCWKCLEMKPDVDIRACEDRLCEDCYLKNEAGLQISREERAGTRSRTVAPKNKTTTSSKITSSQTHSLPTSIKPVSPLTVSKSSAAKTSSSQGSTATKIAKGSKAENKGAPKTDDLVASQAYTENYHVDDTASCSVCNKSTKSDAIEITSLQCCVCSKSYHGECLSIDELLLPLLHVVVDIGGWCCVPCRKLKKTAVSCKSALVITSIVSDRRRPQKRTDSHKGTDRLVEWEPAAAESTTVHITFSSTTSANGDQIICWHSAVKSTIWSQTTDQPESIETQPGQPPQHVAHCRTDSIESIERLPYGSPYHSSSGNVIHSSSFHERGCIGFETKHGVLRRPSL